jgi:hypothetical protein
VTLNIARDEGAFSLQCLVGRRPLSVLHKFWGK